MKRSAAVLILLCACACAVVAQSTPSPSQPAAKPTVAEAERFINDAEARLEELSVAQQRASWVQETNITYDTDIINTEYSERVDTCRTELARQIGRYEQVELSPVMARKFKLLKLSLFSLSDPRELSEHAELSTALLSDYGKGKYCPKDAQTALGRKFAGKCLAISEIEQVLASSRDPEEMKEAWAGWHAVGAPMRQRYTRFIELENKAARELGYKDMGAFWRDGYDMSPDQFSAELERLWNQVRPLYDSLHAYVRTQLVKKYGPTAVTPDGLIRADLLGDPWAQEWGNIYPLVAPKATTGSGYDLTAILQQKKVDELGMVHYGENFFKSLGFEPLPKTFWERSMFVRPRDRDVVCHASAWDIDNQDDLRVKICILIRDEDFVTIHHELGHNFYQRAYKGQPPLFRQGANDGFHEAIGDTIALSITPRYLKQAGLLEQVPQSDDTALLLRRAMDKVAFLPFGLLIDQWRWKVFNGEITPAQYNQGWWQLRAKYQGVVPPVTRSESDFDPGAKMHVAGNVPYTRYFLAEILQFQFYRAMCREAGHTGPLHTCSFFDNKAAGAKLNAMLQMGASRPWPEELKTLTGEDKMDAGALVEYFAPLKKWLDEQNAAAGVKPGWSLPAAPQAGTN